MPDIIGRGENRAVEILKKLYPRYEVLQQVPIKDLIPHSEWKHLGKEHSQHKHDIVMTSTNNEKIIIEVNCDHGQVAEDKWNNVYKPLLESSCHHTCTIEDGECLSLFELEDGVHVDNYQDWIDVINALVNEGIWEEETD